MIIYCLTSAKYSFAQERMVINESYNGNVSYRNSEYISSLTRLPSIIQYNLKRYIESMLGTLSDSMLFSHGQVVDLKEAYKSDTTLYRQEWISPKYDLNYILKDESIGIKKYYVQFKLDEYGQLLFCNWPRKRYSNKNLFKNRSEIEKFALTQAKMKGFNIKDFKVDLKYNSKLEELCWVFKFPISIEERRSSFDVFEIPWRYIAITDEYNLESAESW